jgi:hypothetical protein
MVMEKPDLMDKLLDEYGTQYNATRSGWQSIHCPNDAGHARGDKNPSARLNMDLGLLFCNGCGINGDAYNVLMEIKGVDFKAAKDELGGVAPAIESDWII